MRFIIARSASAAALDSASAVAVRAPAGPLGVFFFGHRVTEVRSWSPLAAHLAVDDRLVSIDAPGRALFTCAGRNVTGLEIIHELRAGAASDGRILTFRPSKGGPE